MSERINARLDADLARKLRHLRARTAQTTTQVLRTAIERYFDAVTAAASPRALLSDFVGCAEGEADLSQQYKSKLATALESKLSAGVGRVGRARRRRTAP